MVFQSLALFNHMTVGENIEFALTMRGVGRETRKRRARRAAWTWCACRANSTPSSVTLCSGGERQRVALARALASDPEILFFDEPLSAIDYRLRKILEMEMKDLHRATGKTFVYITHSLEEAMVMSDRIAVMREGHIVQLGDPLEIYRAPGSRFVAEFMGEVNLIRLERSGSGWRAPELDLDAAQATARRQPGWIVLRPERLRLRERPDRRRRFRDRLFNDYVLGSRTQMHLRRGDQTFIAEVAGAAAMPAPGRQGAGRLRPRRCRRGDGIAMGRGSSAGLARDAADGIAAAVRLCPAGGLRRLDQPDAAADLRARQPPYPRTTTSPR